jgi:hypothetical protein
MAVLYGVLGARIGGDARTGGELRYPLGVVP